MLPLLHLEGCYYKQPAFNSIYQQGNVYLLVIYKQGAINHWIIELNTLISADNISQRLLYIYKEAVIIRHSRGLMLITTAIESYISKLMLFYKLMCLNKEIYLQLVAVIHK